MMQGKIKYIPVNKIMFTVWQEPDVMFYLIVCFEYFEEP